MKSKEKTCKNCQVMNSAPLVEIKNGRCYACRKIVHEKTPDKKISLLAPVTLGAISLYFLMLSISSVYFQYTTILYMGRGRSKTYEFTGVAIIFPVLSFIMFFIVFLTLTLACYDKRKEKITYIKVVARSLFFGFVFHTGAIFFGERVS
ncbi:MULTISPECIES: hypothetical protein [unclassified Pseudomonas]|uniref:hypothetical protein n=1 Tax=unclassified Pseudomonas TaxID=196821 RepID=UPI0015A34B6A|nr:MULTISPECIES: hypothetical protein [unclassified Pseudomonas]NWC95036.1 hypothetical protein [Pseudomonas sp. IPO3779]NWD18304.1 hypothetical protein [Pseudomonas sp. IPO3778]